MAEIQPGARYLDFLHHLRSRFDFTRVDGCCALAAVGWGLVSLKSQTGNPDLCGYFALIVAMWLLTAMAYESARGRSEAELRVRVWVWAILLRVIGLVGTPIYEDDYFRYLWDGRVFAEFGNPYAKAPLEWFGNSQIEDRFQQILSGINYPQLPTIYGPVAELGFLLSYWVAPAALWPWKLILCCADLGTLWLLSRMGSYRQALIYALCPLVIQEIAFNAHTEGILIFFLVLGLKYARESRWNCVAASLGAAMAVKITGGLLAPLLLWRKRWPAWGVLVAFGLLPWVPVWREQAQLLKTVATVWEFNSSIFGLLAGMWNGDVARLVCLILLAGVFLFCLQREASIEMAVCVVGAWLMLSPVVNSWYVLPLVPLLVLRPNAMGWMAAGVVSLSYATGMNLNQPELGAYDHPGWVRPLEYGLIGLAGVWSWARRAVWA